MLRSLEILVTMTIFGVIIVLLTQILILNVELSQKTFMRARIREEISEVLTLIQRDIRNAYYIDECGLDTDTGENRCQIGHVKEFTWTDACPNESVDKICKINSANQLQYETSDEVKIESLNFEIGLSSGEDGTKSTIVVTILASSSNEAFDVKNQVRQLVVSTRNYSL